MRNILGFIYGIIIALIILFLAPHITLNLIKDQLSQIYIKKLSDDFASNVKAKGYITKDMYENFIEKLEHTGKIYNINLLHECRVNEPEYVFRSVEDIIEEDEESWNGPNELHQHIVITTPPEVYDPVYPGELNSETNESILESAINIPADPGHVHTDNCYHGTKHVHTGSSSSGTGCYRGQYSYYTCGSSFSSGNNGVYSGSYTCSNCGGTGSFSYAYLMLTCGNGHSTTFTYNYVSSCSNCKTSYSPPNGTPPSSCGYTYYSYALNCGKIQGAYYDSNGNQVFPICNQKVVSITATHPVQTVATGDALITTVRATYLDGSTKVVLGTSDFSTANPCQSQTATIIYTYTLDGVTHSLTCTITVTVIPRSKTCSRGHTYNLNIDGSDPGCPYCKAWVDNIRVIYPETFTFTITIGTTLQENGLRLLVTYMDGHTEVITSGYADNLDKNYFGTQIVTIGYKGVTTTLQVITVRQKIKCNICGNNYNLHPDGTDPGCPYCKAKIPVFTGNVLEYSKNSYSKEIVELLYTEGIYYMYLGDIFTVNINSNEKPLSFVQGNISLNNITKTTVRISKDGIKY